MCPDLILVEEEEVGGRERWTKMADEGGGPKKIRTILPKTKLTSSSSLEVDFKPGASSWLQELTISLYRLC